MAIPIPTMHANLCGLQRREATALRRPAMRAPISNMACTASCPSRGAMERPLLGAARGEELEDEEEEVDKVEVQVDRAEDVVIVAEVGGDGVCVVEDIERK